MTPGRRLVRSRPIRSCGQLTTTRGKGRVRAGKLGRGDRDRGSRQRLDRKTYGPDRVSFFPDPRLSLVTCRVVRGICRLGCTFMWSRLVATSARLAEDLGRTDRRRNRRMLQCGLPDPWGSKCRRRRTPDAHFYTEVAIAAPNPPWSAPIIPRPPSSATSCLNPQAGTARRLRWPWPFDPREFHLDRQADISRTTPANTPTCRYFASDSTGRPGCRPGCCARTISPAIWVEANNPDLEGPWPYDEATGQIVGAPRLDRVHWGEEGKWNLREGPAKGPERNSPRPESPRELSYVVVGSILFFGRCPDRRLREQRPPRVLTRNIPARPVPLAGDGPPMALVATVFDLSAPLLVLPGLGVRPVVSMDFDDDAPTPPPGPKRSPASDREKIIVVAPLVFRIRGQRPKDTTASP